ncbi:MAG TPA: TolC family protein, partial [Longimicrobiales bacterium]|nr:TolC family protein [Longimicrobiales bacterium]
GLDGIFLGLSLPLPLWDRRAGAIEAAEARASAAESRATLVRRQVRNDVRRALETYNSLARRTDLLVGNGDGADLLEIARVGYAEGEMDLLELLDAAEAFLEAHLAETRLRADFWTSYYDLERAVGGFDGPADDSEDR